MLRVYYPKKMKIWAVTLDITCYCKNDFRQRRNYVFFLVLLPGRDYHVETMGKLCGIVGHKDRTNVDSIRFPPLPLLFLTSGPQTRILRRKTMSSDDGRPE